MVNTFSLDTEEKFKELIIFISDLYEQDIVTTLNDFNIDDNFINEELNVRNITNIGELEENYDDEAEAEFIDFNEAQKEFYLGTYFVNLEDDFDRMGNIKIRTFMKQEIGINPLDVISQYKSLAEERLPLAKLYDEAAEANRQGNENLFKALFDREKIDRMTEIEEELENLGFSCLK